MSDSKSLVRRPQTGGEGSSSSTFTPAVCSCISAESVVTVRKLQLNSVSSEA